MRRPFHISRQRKIAFVGVFLTAMLPCLLLTALFLAQNDIAVQSAAGEAESSSDAVMLLKDLQAQRKIVDVHEHLESAALAGMFVRIMDEMGVGRMILVGSSKFTFTLDERTGFTGYDENNAALIEVLGKYPGRFEAWVTVNPDDPEKLSKLDALFAQGATGVKIYLGNGYVTQEGQYLFHVMAMDDPRMAPLYARCQERFIPLCFHVNPADDKKGFAEELIAVLRAYPDLKINCPHFLLSSIQHTRLEEFLDTFPNLHVDISFGESFIADGLKRISRDPGKFRRLFERYPERFFYGADLVLTRAPGKGESWIRTQWQAYFDMLSRRRYSTPILPGRTLYGLALPPELLERVLYRNYEAFSARRPVGTAITHVPDFDRMQVTPTGRISGQTFSCVGRENASER